MPDSDPEIHPPRAIPQVMVSSTFTDLIEHRAALVQSINEHRLHPNVMEYDSALPDGDVIDSSFRMVRDSHAYILVIGFKYGQTPDDPRNPDGRSLTEMEFDVAQKQGRPMLLFIMGDDHPVKKGYVEIDPVKIAKLDAFRERAKKSDPASKVNRVYATFDSLQEFKDKVAPALFELRRLLDAAPAPVSPDPAPEASPFPKAPAFHARPDYVGLHAFVGRQAELDTLSDWARDADPTSLLLFEAIGGNGKSMLTWEWAKDRAVAARAGQPAWAGRFWYSFYERGAVMDDFCRHALAYLTRGTYETFKDRKTADLKHDLLARLHAEPWLLVLDGLERLLVHYHDIASAERPDEDADAPSDRVLQRDPCATIRDEDGDLLRALAACVPSKILVSSRLVPRVLLNPAGQPIPGVRRLILPGLRPEDAEALLRQSGVRGRSDAIRDYLGQNCDYHPLAIGALAGLIVNYGPKRGDFDAWLADPTAGGALDFGDLPLIQRRNHILDAALAALPDASRQLLSTLALVSESVDYATVAALAEAPARLAATISDLTTRGLLQYDSRSDRYDLHPVVRGVAATRLQPEEKERHGRRVVDYFSARPHNPYEQARTLADVESGLHVVRTLLKLGRHERAADAYRGDLANALLFNLEAYGETLALLRPFFPTGWDTLPSRVDVSSAAYLASSAGIALAGSGESEAARDAYGAAIRGSLKAAYWRHAHGQIRSLATSLEAQNQLAAAFRLESLALDLAAAAREDAEAVFTSRLGLFVSQARLGHLEEAEATWASLDPMGRGWSRSVYRQGDAEYWFALSHYWRGTLREEHLSAAATLVGRGGNRFTLRNLHRLRGSWQLDRKEWSAAAMAFGEAVAMARQRRLVDAASETGLALAKYRDQKSSPDEARAEAARLAAADWVDPLMLARLWLALGDIEAATAHALAAYRWAWADGEPYVHRFDLTQAGALLDELGVPRPELPPYDPEKEKPFPWEAQVRAAIEKMEAKKAAQRKEAAKRKRAAKRKNSPKAKKPRPRP